ncbi:MAG: Multifunctional-autoprocessing repeats-in-toxin [Chlamydiae bacterium]|nr:Multifunctional-autoprocessing repeats-in-toxin [Chlamydiota bacterium]
MATIDTHARQNIPFHAEWPKALDPQLESILFKVARVAWDILSIIIFPIGLVRLGIWALKKFAISQIYPAPLKYQADAEKLLTSKKGVRVTITSPQNVKLETAYFPGGSEKAILHFPGLGNQWEYCGNEIAELLAPQDAHLLMVNSRWCTAGNPPPDKEGLALDAWTAFNYLVNEKGIAPENILFMGHSMGGAVATLGAALAQEEYPDIEIKLISWNSFHSLASAAKHLIAQESKCCFGIAAHLAYWGMKIAGDIDVTAALATVKNKAVIWNREDETVLHPAQIIHHARGGYSFEMSPGPTACSEHNRYFSDVEAQALHTLIKKLFDHHITHAEEDHFQQLVNCI